MGVVKTYDPNLVIVTFNGVPISGYADGTFINIVPSSPRWSKSVGADGEVARGKSNDRTSEVTLTLMQTSLSNTYLSGILAIDSSTGLGALPLQVLDLSGTSLFFWLQAWIRQPPDSGYAKDVGDRAWVFDTGQPTIYTVGGDAT